MQDITSTRIRIEILSTIDELNQYLNGYVTTEALRDALEDCLLALDGHFPTYVTITKV
jgi:hypothetical protein